MNIQRAMHVANRAKTIGDYTIANILFAVLLENIFASRGIFGGKGNVSRDEPGLFIVPYVETQDLDGACPGETYYDLLTLVAMNESGPIVSLCIPIPLLTFEAAITALKRAKFIERDEHTREHVTPETDEIKLLWDEVLQEIEQNFLYECVTSHLSDEALEKMVVPIPVQALQS